LLAWLASLLPKFGLNSVYKFPGSGNATLSNWSSSVYNLLLVFSTADTDTDGTGVSTTCGVYFATGFLPDLRFLLFFFFCALDCDFASASCSNLLYLFGASLPLSAEISFFESS
jgi:hypothetical protein